MAKSKTVNGKGILDKDKFLTNFISMYMDKKSGIQGSLILCLLRAIIAKASGHKNPEYGNKVQQFMLCLSATNKQACELVCGNLNLAGDRWIRRLAAKTRSKPMILNTPDDIVKIIVSRVEKIRAGFGDSARIAFSCGVDATKLVKGFGYLQGADVIVGGAFPQHVIDVSNLTKDEKKQRLRALVKGEEVVELASEVKMCIAEFQYTPAGMTPHLAIGFLPQTINDNNDWGDGVLKAW